MQHAAARRSSLKVSGLALAVAYLQASWASAHRPGCHRQYSCPADSSAYICADLGKCSQCPGNQYCVGRHPRSQTGPFSQGQAPGFPLRNRSVSNKSPWRSSSAARLSE